MDTQPSTCCREAASHPLYGPSALEEGIGGQPAACRAVIALPAEARHVAKIRLFAAAHLARWGVHADDCDSAVLIVSELAGNAAQHGCSDMTVGLGRTGAVVHIEVADFGESAQGSASRARPEDAQGEHGRGLGIVESLAERFEFAPAHGGIRARAALRLTLEAPSSAATEAAATGPSRITAA